VAFTILEICFWDAQMFYGIEGAKFSKDFKKLSEKNAGVSYAKQSKTRYADTA